MWKLSLALIAFLSCFAFSVFPTTSRADQLGAPIDLEADWLNGDAELKPEYFERLIVLGQRDPNVVALFERAKKRYGFEDIHQLKDFIQVKKISSAGRTLRQIYHMRYYPTLDDLVASENAPEKFKAIMDEKIKVDLAEWKVLFSSTRYFSDYAEISFLQSLTILMKPGRSLLMAYTDFVHELTHAVDEDPFYEADPVLYAEAEKFKIDEVSLRGNEVDAYLFESYARIFITKDPTRVIVAVAPFFTAEGLFNGDREGLAKVILRSQNEGGLGYDKSKFAQAFPDLLASRLEKSLAKRNRIAGEINSRNAQAATYRQQLAAAKNNFPIFESRLERAKATKDAALEAKTLEDITYWKSLEERATTRLRVAEAAVVRLTDDLKKRDEYLVALRARIDAWNLENTPVP